MIAALLAAAVIVQNEPVRFTAVPVRAPAKSWAVRVAESAMRMNPVVSDKWDYTAGLMLLAMERVGAATHDPKYAAYVKRSIDSLVHADGTIATYSRDEYNL